MAFIIETTAEFDSWLNKQPAMILGLVRTRLSRIELSDHFGTVRPVGNGVSELKWKNGLRVYFAHLERKKLLSF